MDSLQLSGLTQPGGQQGAAPAALIKDATTRSFEADVIRASMNVPVILDLWAPWCGPCKQLGPLLEKVVTEAKGAVLLVKVNIDQSPEIAQALRVQSIPAVFAFKDGRPVDGFVGALPESQIRAFVAKLGGGPQPSPVAEALAQAKEWLAAGDTPTAQNLFEQILEVEPGNMAATGGLARCHLASGAIDKARAVLAAITDEQKKDPEVAAALSALDLAERAGKAGPVDSLKARIDADPKNHQARYDLAVALFAQGDVEAAMDHLLEIVRVDRKWNDDAARKELLKMFEAMGPTDPATLAGRRQLSSLLFS